jgi:hypothetical protein
LLDPFQLCVKKHYPGWHQIYGGYWEGYRALADPAAAISCYRNSRLAAVLPGLPIAMRDAPSRPERSVDRRSWRQKFALCSEGCEWIFANWPRVYASRKQFWERYHGWDLAGAILDLGYVRPDGKTLIRQPPLDLERLWTIEDIRRLKYAIKDPLLEQGRYLRYSCKNGGCGS